jgi:AmiR/NasT family two-component response regulator
MATPDDVRNWFTYHQPTDDQQERYAELRDAFRELADEILMKTPSCADQTAALRMLRETAMAVNQTIACNEDAKP